ncbi:uncharacterized protein LOC127247451 isoform X2 [Andrographis paniculata]|uniref:uncharacterized protein LOC127247451 isoform X2 n=1 Tax=Andrographis paniculata TaxID=175694 RepID=UPI0021E994E5|nr:uncharacterized protein LOC127247451 isoform X2 [Andrographis paniculata]
MENDGAECGPEESSWTFYIEGFMCENNGGCLSSELEESPSLVSDAASSAVKINYKNNHLITTAANDCCNYNQVGFSAAKKLDDHHHFTAYNNKKHKNKVIPPVDYDLEDTASSPVNSPKVSYMTNQFMRQKQKTNKEYPADHHHHHLNQVKRNIFGKEGGLYGGERNS